VRRRTVRPLCFARGVARIYARSVRAARSASGPYLALRAGALSRVGQVTGCSPAWPAGGTPGRRGAGGRGKPGHLHEQDRIA